MPVVYEDLEMPGGEPAFRAICTYTLVGEHGEQVPEIAYNDQLETVAGVRTTRANSIGRTTVDLDANTLITPTGTRYRRRVVTAGASSGVDSDVYILVPDGPGPYNLIDLLSSMPPVIIDPDVEANLLSQIDQLRQDFESLEDAPLFIQDDAPVTTLDQYLWIQTNYLVPGGITFWLEDGS